MGGEVKKELLLYNGPKSILMDEIYKALSGRIDLDMSNEWSVLSLYLARICRVLENNGWRKNNIKVEFKEKGKWVEEDDQIYK